MIKRLTRFMIILGLTSVLVSCSSKSSLIELPVDMITISNDFNELYTEDSAKELIQEEIDFINGILELLPNDKRSVISSNPSILKIEDNLHIWSTEVGTVPSKNIDNSIDYLKFTLTKDGDKFISTIDLKVIPNKKDKIKLGNFDKRLLRYFDPNIDLNMIEEKLNELKQSEMYAEEPLVIGDVKFRASKSPNSVILYRTVNN